ncbi:MAG: DegT/DnrJ/EryC1/StrS family aminotransferase [Candidatus Paceibacterota bacterium]|jgi:perosamine synthetase
MRSILQMEPWFDEQETEALNVYMRGGGWVTEFQKTREFEKMIAEYAGAKYCSVVANGTVSLVLALFACDVGPGDEVLVPDYTMVASANSVALTGAKVVFVDITKNDLCMDFEQMKKSVTPKTKAVILVTINGRYPENIEEFVSWCKERNIKVVEDAAQSLGSFKNGKHLGTFGDVGSFSFSAPKVITTGQGGALITNSDALIDRIRKMRDFGRDKPGSDHYLTMGWNFKFTDIQAVIGIEQMKKLPWRVERKKKIYEHYYENLKNVEGVSFVSTNTKNTSPWFIDLLIKEGKRDLLAEYLKQRGVGTRTFYPALHAEPVYGIKKSYPIAEEVAQEGLWLPSASKLTDEEIDFICDQIKSFFVNVQK